MGTTYEVTIIGKPQPATPVIHVDGKPLGDGERAVVPLPMAVNLIERGYAVPRGNVEIEAVLKPKGRPAIMIEGRACYDGDRVSVSWELASLLIARGHARLPEGVRFPVNDPDASK